MELPQIPTDGGPEEEPPELLTPEYTAIVIEEDESGDPVAIAPLDGLTPQQTFEQFCDLHQDTRENYLDFGGANFLIPPMGPTNYGVRLRDVMIDYYAHTLVIRGPLRHLKIREFGQNVNAHTTLHSLTGYLFAFYNNDHSVIVPQLLAAANVEVKKTGFWIDATL